MAAARDSTAIPMDNPATTPTSLATDTFNAESGASRMATSGTTTANTGGCVAPSQTQSSQLTAAATRMRAI